LAAVAALLAFLLADLVCGTGQIAVLLAIQKLPPPLGGEPDFVLHTHCFEPRYL